MPALTDSLFSALETASCGAYAATIDQRIVFWNEAAAEILGFQSDEIVGRRCYEVLKSGAPGGLTPQCLGGCPSIRHLRAGLVPGATRLQMACSSGERKWVAVTAMVISGIFKDAPLLVHLFEDGEDAADFDEAQTAVRDDLEAGGAEIVAGQPLPPPTVVGSSVLTAREVEVLRLVAVGRGATEIAQELGISLHTVRNHIRNLRHKLNSTTKLDAVVKAIRMGILTPDQLE